MKPFGWLEPIALLCASTPIAISLVGTGIYNRTPLWCHHVSVANAVTARGRVRSGLSAVFSRRYPHLYQLRLPVKWLPLGLRCVRARLGRATDPEPLHLRSRCFPDGKLVAIGEIGFLGEANVYLFDAETLAPARGSPKKVPVPATLRFSSDSNQLYVVNNAGTQGPEHSLFCSPSS